MILVGLTAFLTLLITELGRKLLRTLWKPVAWVKDKAYSFLAPRFPHWIGVPGYRNRVQRSELSRIEIPVGPKTIRVDPKNPKKEVELVVPLEQAYAPLMLVTGHRQERVDLLQFAVTHRRLIVLGGPGTGKTTLMKSLVLSILRRRCQEELNRLVPVFITLRDMAKPGQTVQKAITDTLGSFGFKDARRFVESALESG